MKQYDKGYLNGQLDSAENELDILYRIKEDSNEIWHDNSILITDFPNEKAHAGRSPSLDMG